MGVLRSLADRTAEFLPLALGSVTVVNETFFIMKLVYRKAEFSHNSAFRLFTFIPSDLNVFLFLSFCGQKAAGCLGLFSVV